MAHWTLRLSAATLSMIGSLCGATAFEDCGVCLKIPFSYCQEHVRHFLFLYGTFTLSRTKCMIFQDNHLHRDKSLQLLVTKILLQLKIQNFREICMFHDLCLVTCCMLPLLNHDQNSLLSSSGMFMTGPMFIHLFIDML